MPFDDGTLRQLDVWLEHYVHRDRVREKVRERMLEFAADDSEYWSSQNWFNLYDRSGCFKIVRAAYAEETREDLKHLRFIGKL